MKEYKNIIMTIIIQMTVNFGILTCVASGFLETYFFISILGNYKMVVIIVVIAIELYKFLLSYKITKKKSENEESNYKSDNAYKLLFTCVSFIATIFLVSASLLPNFDDIIETEKNVLISQYEQHIEEAIKKEEDLISDSYKQRIQEIDLSISKLEEQKNLERESGIGEKYRGIDKEIGDLRSQRNNWISKRQMEMKKVNSNDDNGKIKELSNELNDKIQELESDNSKIKDNAKYHNRFVSKSIKGMLSLLGISYSFKIYKVVVIVIALLFSILMESVIQLSAKCLYEMNTDEHKDILKNTNFVIYSGVMSMLLVVLFSYKHGIEPKNMLLTIVLMLFAASISYFINSKSSINEKSAKPIWKKLKLCSNRAITTTTLFIVTAIVVTNIFPNAPIFVSLNHIAGYLVAVLSSEAVTLL